MTLRSLVIGLATNRLLLGAGLTLVPGRAARVWVGRAAGRPSGRLLARAIGARDVALGVGTLAALKDGDAARAWVGAMLVSDATDFAATLHEREHLPLPAALATLGMAGISTGVAAAYLLLGGSDGVGDQPARTA